MVSTQQEFHLVNLSHILNIRIEDCRNASNLLPVQRFGSMFIWSKLSILSLWFGEAGRAT
jgi:hypothetical protein